MRRRLILCATALLLPACSAIQPLIAPLPHPKYYSLNYTPDSPGAVRQNNPAPTHAKTLVISPPHAAAGFDSQRMVYLRHADQPEYFAYNEWIDTPARMLAPLIVSSIADSSRFRAVVLTPSPASGELRLDTEILRLQQEFFSTPGRVRFTLRAYLVESATRKVIASREFEAVVPSASEDPHGGVMAANSAVQSVLGDLSTFCAETARNRR
jgi:cholesterol transport system auxiliary component